MSPLNHLSSWRIHSWGHLSCPPLYEDWLILLRSIKLVWEFGGIAILSLSTRKLRQAFVLLLYEAKSPRRVNFARRTLKKFCEGLDFTSTRESGAKTLWDPLARLSDLREIWLPCEFFNRSSQRGELNFDKRIMHHFSCFFCSYCWIWLLGYSHLFTCYCVFGCRFCDKPTHYMSNNLSNK